MRRVFLGSFLALLGATACSSHPPEASAPLRIGNPSPIEIEYRFVDAAAPADARSHRAPETGEPLALRDEVVLNLSHVARAEVSGDQGLEHAVTLFLTAEGRDRLAHGTRSHAGQQLGILIDGELVQIPYIVNEFDTGQIPVRTRLSRDDANALAARINAAVADGR